VTQGQGDAPAREVTARALRRLGWLETGLALTGAGFALLAGAVTGLVLSEGLGWPFRAVWWMSSLMYFVVPVGIVLVRDRRQQAAHRARLERERHEQQGETRDG